jgi:uncharacterized ParB-like nuclease family protein
MSKAKTQMIKLRDIVVPPNRMRQLRPEKVDEFAESIATRGQLQPIIVRPRGDTDYLLVVGLHRLEAVRKLEHEAIECRVLDGMDADQALLAEIDENLVRADLTSAERAAHHAKRKQLYLKLHPETENGKAGGLVIRAALAQRFRRLGQHAAERIQGTRLSADSSASWRTDLVPRTLGQPGPASRPSAGAGRDDADPEGAPAPPKATVHQFDQRRR